MLRILDLIIAGLAILLLLPFIIFIYILLYFENKSPLLYQVRIGKNMSRFVLIKFRTMALDTKSCATHLVDSSKITRFGSVLRKTKLDEIPQLFNVIKGEMSLVGPRPCLPSQEELINLRNKYNLYNFLPGITGLAQIKRIDMSDPKLLSKTEYRMMCNLNIYRYFYYLIMTFIGKGFGDRIKII